MTYIVEEPCDAGAALTSLSLIWLYHTLVLSRGNPVWPNVLSLNRLDFCLFLIFLLQWRVK